MAPEDDASHATPWALPEPKLFDLVGSAARGLSIEEAARRLAARRETEKRAPHERTTLHLLAARFKSPLTLILIAAAGLAYVLQDHTDGPIILAIVLASALLGFWQERGATGAVARLLALVRTRSDVARGGESVEIDASDVVVGDVVLLSAGSAVPGDGRLLEARDLFVNEAALTGESYPVEKTVGTVARDAPLARRTNWVFQGTSVVSGSARALIFATGGATEYGRISERLRLRPPETEFERGIRRFGYLLMEVTLLLVGGIFTANVYFHKPIVDSLLFSLALAVGLTPQLLPAVIAVNLSRGARRMAARDVIVKRLNSIENFGAMNVLCSDKTGTLTKGTVRIRRALDAEGRESRDVLVDAYLNAAFESGFTNPIDAAIRETKAVDPSAYAKIDERPYDFARKRLSVIVAQGDRRWMITKGALDGILASSVKARLADGAVVALGEVEDRVREIYRAESAQGRRVLGVAVRETPGAQAIGAADEEGMTFAGLLVLEDPPKANVREVIADLARLGVGFKVITGDNALVARSIAERVGIAAPRVLTGPELRRTADEALVRAAGDVDVFAEVEPNQKERIIRALQKAGNVVGYLGDGINDASALHAADVGISVDTAVDVAKEAADIVLLRRSLRVLREGILEGRRTFANTLKYVFMASSANFGNMFSMAGASLFLPFLPLLPKQILLTNLATDFPAMALASDPVDEEWTNQPRRWDIRAIRRFMLAFGLLSSVFDHVTFGVLYWALRAGPDAFRTGWFVESVLSATLVVLVIRTRRPAARSRPGPALVAATFGVLAVVVALPYSPLAPALGLVPLPLGLIGLLAAIVAAYLLSAEVLKTLYYRRVAGA
ncbi:MAG: magnesium-translocating P-type ATPase [Myxococcales bacterium]|nr:magnesium-translocating P-type ATPase [Myxococcales bacterium]